MTYYIAESAVAGPNQQKLIVEIWTTPDVNAINWDTYTVSVRRKYSTYQALYSGDNQTLNRTGSYTGSTNFYMPASAPTTVVIADETSNVSTQEGNAVGVTVGATITGHYNGASFSASKYFEIAARPYPASSFTLGSDNFDMGTSVPINITRLNSAFKHTVRYAFGSASGTIASNVDTATTWNFPTATLAPQVPNATSGVGTIFVDTYNGSTLVGTTSKTFTAKVPSSVVPTLGTVSAVESVALVNSTVGRFVRYLTKPTLSMSGISGAHSSTISKMEITYQGVTYDLTQAGSTSKSITMVDPIQNDGNVNIVGKVTDSRGRTTSKTLTVNVLTYSVPKITNFIVQRCDAAGALNTLGTYAKVTSAGSVSSLVNSTERNALTYTVFFRERGTTTWTQLKTATLATGTVALNANETLGTGQFSPTKAYEFRLDVKDKFNTTTSILVIGTSEVTMSWNKTGVSFGKVWERGSIDAAGMIFGKPGILDISTDTATLDTYGGGYYIQKTGAGATTARKFPTQYPGILQVYELDANNSLQKYSTGYADGSNLGGEWVREKSMGAWNVWYRIDQPAIPIGRLAKTNGFQTMTASGVGIVMANDFVVGGMTYDASNGGSLKIPVTAYYRVSSKLYCTGSSGWLGTGDVRLYKGTTHSRSLLVILVDKPDSNDYTGSDSDIFLLKANDLITLFGSSTNGLGSTWGNSDKVGSHLTVEYVRPA